MVTPCLEEARTLLCYAVVAIARPRRLTPSNRSLHIAPMQSRCYTHTDSIDVQHPSVTLTRRQLLTRLSALGLASLLPVARYAFRSRPNVVVFLADDLRYDMVGFTGNRIVHTPNLDALAREGLAFSRCFAPAPLCPCSRASILTGQYTMRHGVTSYSTPLAYAVLDSTYPVLMRADGYFTGLIGKWGVGNERSAAKQFDFWEGFYERSRYYADRDSQRMHLNDEQRGHILRFLQNVPDRPFLLMVHFKAPHEPLTPQPEFAALYESVTVPPVPTNTREALDALPPMLKDTYFANRGRRYRNHERFQRDMRRYLALVSGMDAVIGDTIAALKAGGQYANTLIIFTSDNGLLLGEHRLRGKHVMYEEAIRVPLLVRLPNGAAVTADPRRLNRLVLNIDLAPTILDIAGIEVPAGIQGVSLMHLLKGTARWRSEFPLINHRDAVYPTSRGIRTTRWKYVEYLPAEGRPQRQLFDLRADPYEEHNLVQSKHYAAIRSDLRTRMHLLLDEHG